MTDSTAWKLKALTLALPFALFACGADESRGSADGTGGGAAATTGGTSTGGPSTGGSATGGGTASGGTVAGAGGMASGGAGIGGASTGGTSTGGTAPATGGSNTGGAPPATGGAPPGTGGAGETGGAAPGTGGTAANTGGTTANTGGTAANTGGTAASTGGTTANTGGTTDTGGTDGIGGTVQGPDVDAYFRDWPAGADPLEVGRSAADVFLAQNLPQGSGDDPNDDYKHYKDACAWYGSLSIATLLSDQNLTGGLVAKYEPYKNTWSGFDPPTRQNSYTGHVDNNVFGIVPLEIAKIDSDPIYLEEGDLAADHQVEFIQEQIRFAIDDMFMITSLQVQAYRVIEDEAHRNRHLNIAAETMVTYLDTMQRKDTQEGAIGLFPHHRDNASFRIAWGRGNGWYAAGMAEMIRELPESHPLYQSIFDGYKLMMDALLEHQVPQGQPGAGLWRQVVDSTDSRNWAETSGSAMFTYALVSGVRRGWLDVDTYGPAARAAWLGLVAQVSGGRIQNVSNWAYLPSSHEGGPSYAGDEENYYFERDRLTGDNHGQAPLMWAAAALARPLN